MFVNLPMAGEVYIFCCLLGLGTGIHPLHCTPTVVLLPAAEIEGIHKSKVLIHMNPCW